MTEIAGEDSVVMGAPQAGARRPSRAQREWLRRGLDQPGGKLPLFDANGRKVDHRVVSACMEKGWATPWFSNPIKPDWLVCKLTKAGAAVVKEP